ncbi:MAG: helix-turn-helix domain-containing protein [Chloroflexi bacterium]|nr:helix-turn-helix domain-containing protein [Chloroflexota bacterium]
MNSCSIRDLLRLALPPGTRLLTPKRGLRQPISYALSLRVTPPAFPTLRGGELVLLSLQEALALDESLTLPNIVARLGEVRVGAIAYVGAPDTAAIAAATTLDLPLLQLPDGVHLKAVERDALYLINSPDLQIERRAAQFYHALTLQVASGTGIEALLTTIQAATDRPVALYNPAGDLLYQLGTQSSKELFHDLRPATLIDANLSGHPFIVKGIGQSATILGYLALAGSNLDLWDDTAAGQAAAALHLELAKQQAVESVEARLGGEFLQSIISGSPTNLVALQEQAAELGYNLHQPHAAILIASADGKLSADKLRDRLQALLRREQMSAPHVLYDQTVLCLLPTDEQLEQAWKIVRLLADELTISAGISQPATTIGEWQRRYNEATQTLALGRHLFGPYSLTAFRDLHIYRLLFELRASPELWSFYHATLGTLIEYDREHRSALIETLEAYFAVQGNLIQASERLHIHRNTLLYRLRRISQLNGINLECAEEMLALQVALKAHRVLHTMREPPADQRGIAAAAQPTASSFGRERLGALSELVMPRNGSSPK